MPTAALDQRRSSRRLSTLVATTWAGALGGAVLLVAATLSGGPADDPARGDARATAPVRAEIGGRIPTSFGSVSVDTAARLAGPRSASGLRLARGDLPLQVAVTLVNTSGRPVPYGRENFRLLGVAGAPAIAVGGGDRGQDVDARAARRFILRFAVPPGDVLPQLEVRDPGDGSRATVSLGARAALPIFDHVDHTTGPDGRRHP
jgi:hypothetical protein